MYKTVSLITIVVVVVGCVSARTHTFNIQSSHIKRALLPIQQKTNGFDWCSQCINSFDILLELTLDTILQYDIMDSCGELCQIVAQKSGSEFVGFLCTVGCDALGIAAFVKLLNDADLDPIYYCEIIKICPVNDNGDAKFTSFTISPHSGPIGTTFSMNFVYTSTNGTGTGQIMISIETVDKVPVANAFLLEAQKPGTYGERITLEASRDPDCHPQQEPCERWKHGTYNVTLMLCNGQCGSHHPHTQLYDTARGSFKILK